MASPSAARRRVVEPPSRRPPVELHSIHLVVEPDPYASEENLVWSDERRAAYKRGEFGFLLVRAVADVSIENTPQTLTSVGCGLVESDGDDDYMGEIFSEEWAELRDVLKAVGVPTKKLPLEVEREWIDWRT